MAKVFESPDPITVACAPEITMFLLLAVHHEIPFPEKAQSEVF
jgi:hypothetical protein